MESMTTCRQRVEALRCRARAQVDVLRVLEKAFDREAEYLRRHDQAQRLEALQARVAQDVADIRRREVTASLSFNEVALISGLAKFAFGSLIGVALRTEEHPFAVGAKLAASDFTRSEPFGTVVVAVGPGGVPHEVDVIPLSRYARELGRAESGIVATIEARSYRLMTPEAFFRTLDELKQRVLNGVLTLPVASASFLLKRADGDPE